jgi:hypothetical protein
VLQFFATDDEVQEWLNHCLLPKYAPYRLIPTPQWARPGDQIRTHAVEDLLQTLATCESTSFFLWSQAISPRLLLNIPQNLVAWCSINGLPNLDHGFDWRGTRRESALGFVERIENKHTGEIRIHVEYREVYNRLRREIVKALRYSTFHRFADGTEREDTSLRRMTEAAAQAHGHGIVFNARPGRRLDGGS